MILRSLPLVLFAVVFAPGLLHAQPHLLEGQPIFIDIDRPPNHDKMYEDIEIMRRILDKKLHGLYPSRTYQTFGMSGMQGGMYGMPGGMYGMEERKGMGGINGMLGGMGGMWGGMGMGGGMMPVTVSLPSLEGVYLKGQGVVYTATLASLQPPAKAEAHRSGNAYQAFLQSAHVNSEWESIRRQVRNEKEKPKKPEASKQPSLSDVLLKVLAENGHHFSQLGENESLTIIITVHDANAPLPPAKSGEGSAKTESKLSNTSGGSDLQSQVRDLELLGELHLKQGKYNEAIEALHKAMVMTKSPKRNAELCRKLAQCYLMRQDPADFRNARATLEEALALMEKDKEAKNEPAPAAKPAPALPVKLIISAPKKLLDQAKEGKIAFEEFRRQAHVETLRFDHRR